MTTTSVNATDLRGEARVAVLEARETLESWQAKIESCSAEIEGFNDLRPSDLKDPNAATRRAEGVARAEAERRLATRGVELQDTVLLDAETAYVQACLLVAREAAAASTTTYVAHQVRTDKLLSDLLAHQGCQGRLELVWPPYTRGDDLRELRDRAGRTVEMLQALLDGEQLEDLTAHWMAFDSVDSISPEPHLPDSLHGASAVVPYRHYLARRRAQQSVT